MTSLSNNPNRYSWTTLNIDGYDDTLRDTGDLTKISVISDLLQVKSLTIQFGKSPFNQVEFDKVMDAIKDYKNLTYLYIFFYNPQGTGSGKITNINKLKTVLENNKNINRLRLHFGANHLDDTTCSNLLPIQHLTQLNYELSMYFWGSKIVDVSCLATILPPLQTLKRLNFNVENNEVNDITSLTNAFSSLSQVFYIHLNLRHNPFTVFPLQESFKDLIKLTQLILYLTPENGAKYENVTIYSEYITQYTVMIKEGSIDKTTANNFFLNMPNLYKVTFLVRYDSFSYEDLKFFTDQLKDSPKFKYWVFNSYYQKSSYSRQIDLSQWGDLFDQVRDKLEYVFYDQYQQDYNQDYTQWTHILRDTPKLWYLQLKQRYNLGNNTVDIAKVSHPNITHFYLRFERTNKIVNKWNEFADVYAQLPNLQYVQFYCSYCSLTNDNMSGFDNIYKSLVGRTLSNRFQIYLPRNSITDVSALINPHGVIDLREFLQINMQYNQLENLDNMGPVLKSIADPSTFKLFYMYMEYNKIIDIRGLSTTFIDFKMKEMYFEMENNQIEDLGQLKGMLDGQGGEGTIFQKLRIYTSGNPIIQQSALNEVLLPINYYGKSQVIEIYLQLKDPSYSTTQSHKKLNTNGIYPAIHDNGYCMSNYSQAYYYYETLDVNDKIIKNCGNCVNINCHSCSNNSTCDRCRYSVPARVLNKNCDCPDGYYGGENYSCLKCMKLCATCDNGNNCLTCATSNPARSTNMCICPDNYYDDGTNIQCQNCITGCNICDNGNTCQDCLDGFYLNSSNICVKCPNKYAKCTSNNVGTECQGNNRSSTTPNCPCNSGYYDDNTNANCNICVNICKTCTSSSVCQSCVTGYYLNVTTCTKCPNKFSACQTSTVGDSCQGNNRSNVTPECKCNDGYFDDGTNKADCSICQSPCKTCEDTNSKCLSCINGYYLSGNNCIKCPNKFAKCSNATTGTLCQGDNRSSTTPNCPCNSGYYDDNTNANCNICVNNCKTCTSNSVCQSCDNGYYLSGTTCPQCPNKFETCSDQTTGIKCQGTNRSSTTPNCPCKDGYFDDGTNKADCTICQSPCKTCQDTNSKCLSCIDGYYLDGNNCIKCPNKFAKCSNATTGTLCQGDNRSSTTPNCPCNSGYYDDNTNANCNICVNNCKTCTSNSVCQSCDNGFYLLGTTCPQCPNKYETCSDQTTGIKCQGNNRSTITPDCHCNDGYFDDGTNKTDCTICLSPCQTCEDNDTKCLSCIDGYYLDGNNCILCPNKYAKCTNATTGTLCQGDNRSSTTPDCPCNNGYYDDLVNANCVQCQYPCKFCDKDKCLSCTDNINRNQNDTCSCQTNYYDNISNQACEKCYFRCNTCSSDFNQCDTCSHTTRDDQQNCICQDTFYEIQDQAMCQECIPPCINCTSDTECKSCLFEGQPHRNSIPTCTCEDGYYEDQDSKDCLKCPEKCSKCSDANTCTECNSAPGDERTHNVNDNCGCNTGFYDDQTNTLQCQQCQYPCTQCVSLEQCVIGQCSTLENRNLTSQLCSCSDGYYDNGQNCQNCELKCLKCHESSDFCTGLECAGNGTRHKYPQCECIEGLKEIGKAECGICANKCKECFGSETQCTVCAEGKGRLQINDSCNCMDSYYDDGIHSDCQECFSQCKTCSSADECDTCYADNLDPKQKCIQQLVQGQASFSVTNPVTNQVEQMVCEIQCKECENQVNFCKNCNIGINRQDNAPHCSCKQGYHDNNGTQVDCLEKCDSACLTCSNSKLCTSCDETNFWVMDVTTMMCRCIQGYTQSITNNNQKECIKCNYYYKGMCVQQCPQSTLHDKSTKQCMDVEYVQKNNFVYIVSIGVAVITIKVSLFFVLRFIFKKFFGQKLQKIQYQANLQKSQVNIQVSIENEEISSKQSSDNFSSSKSSNSGDQKPKRQSLRQKRQNLGTKPVVSRKSLKQPNNGTGKKQHFIDQ